jgi:hypothetical protein
MSYYKVNKTDGTLITEVIDGQLDSTTLDITLIGKNSTSYGELINENFVRLLENFASSSPPQKPLVGQLWYDVTNGRLQIYDGYRFKNGVGTVVSPTNPTTLVEGDLWIDNLNKQLHFYDGIDTVLIGPIYKASHGLSGFEIDTVYDKNNKRHTLTKVFSGGKLLGFISGDTYSLKTPLQYFNDVVSTRVMNIGFNTASNVEYKTDAISARSLALYDTTSATIKTLNQLLFSDEDSITTGSLKIQNSDGLYIGSYNETHLYADGQNNFVIEQAFTESNMVFRVKRVSYVDGSPVGVLNEDAITIDAENKKVSLYEVGYYSNSSEVTTNSSVIDQVLELTAPIILEYNIVAYDTETDDYTTFRYTIYTPTLTATSDLLIKSNNANDVITLSVAVVNTYIQVSAVGTSNTIIVKFRRTEI